MGGDFVTNVRFHLRHDSVAHCRETNYEFRVNSMQELSAELRLVLRRVWPLNERMADANGTANWKEVRFVPIDCGKVLRRINSRLGIQSAHCIGRFTGETNVTNRQKRG